MSYIICDLDGTLADCEHRRHHVTGDKQDWDAFFGGLEQDEIVEPVAVVLRALFFNSVCDIVFVTGRPEKYAGFTLRWLERNLLRHCSFELHCRANDDLRPDEVMKAEIFERDIEPDRGKPLFVLDDRQKVVDMWRAKGITCFQVAPGDF